ncbi:hypothetical protein H1C71_035151 [Ictidomys tridecemlineatus]|nr:hypothetical protein H1C71_035151 [Ictidomys tridecemlineatus]
MACDPREPRTSPPPTYPLLSALLSALLLRRLLVGELGGRGRCALLPLNASSTPNGPLPGRIRGHSDSKCHLTCPGPGSLSGEDSRTLFPLFCSVVLVWHYCKP